MAFFLLVVFGTIRSFVVSGENKQCPKLPSRVIIKAMSDFEIGQHFSFMVFQILMNLSFSSGKLFPFFFSAH